MFEDWFVDLTTIISNTIVALSALGAVLLAYRGLRQWREELTGKARYEVARKMALLAMRIRNEFFYARSPLTLKGESADRPNEFDESVSEAHVLDEYYARVQRVATLQDTLLELGQANWEAVVVIGEDFKEEIQLLQTPIRELNAAVLGWFETQRLRARTGQKNVEYDDFLQSQLKIVYGTADDELSVAVDSAVDSLVTRLQAHIRRPGHPRPRSR